MNRRALLLAAVLLTACSAATGRTFTLATLNDSGVSGSATLTDLGDGTTRVVISVEPAGHPDMPAHIHPGSCAELVPQPRYPLRNVVDGASETVVSASLEDLLAGGLALNLHASNDDMGTYTACVDLGPPTSTSEAPRSAGEPTSSAGDLRSFGDDGGY